MLPRAFLLGLMLTVGIGLGVGPGSSAAHAAAPVAFPGAAAITAAPTVADGALVATIPPADPPPDTVNPFLPADRSISDCISAAPKPGCGSKERGGWRQTLIFIALVGGLSIIGWRIIAGARENGRVNAARLRSSDAARVESSPGESSPGDSPPPPATMNGDPHQQTKP